MDYGYLTIPDGPFIYIVIITAVLFIAFGEWWLRR